MIVRAKAFVWACAAVLLCVSVCPRFAVSETINMNLDPNGRTSNHTLYDTSLVGGIATWSSTATRYRDYQFELQTSSGTASFDGFAVRLSGQLRNSTSPSNLLRATLWSGPIVANPLLADAIVTVSTPNSAMTSSGYSSVVLAGPGFTPVTISSSPTTFFFRVWAEGAGENNGYQTKMAASLDEYKIVTMAPSPTIDGFIEYDTNSDGTIDSGEEAATRDPIAEVVPEIDPQAAGGVLALVTGMLGLLERRRTRAA